VSFVNSPSNLHIAPGGNAASINNAGISLPPITIDIDYDARNATTPDIGADEFSIPLAIAMEYFTGAKYPNNNLLNWKAYCSAASTTFEIQRSADGRNFKAIGNLTANKERCLMPFAFSDASPADGINYYRLKITESDGLVTYSAIIAIINRNTGIKIISLNPTVINKGYAVLQVAAAKAGKLKLTVFDINGRLIQTKWSAVTAGSNVLRLDVATLAAGSYLLHVSDEDGSATTIRLLKQ